MISSIHAAEAPHGSDSDVDIIVHIRNLLKEYDGRNNNSELIRLLSQAVEIARGQNEPVSDNSTSLNAAKLASLMKGHAYNPDEISFKRFTSLNVTNILLCEHELMMLSRSYAANPELLLHAGAAENLRKKLADYSTFLLALQRTWLIMTLDAALSNYECVLRYKQANPARIFLNVKFSRLFRELYPSSDSNQSKRISKVYNDYLMIQPEQPNLLRTLLAKSSLRRLVYTSEERENHIWMADYGAESVGHELRIDKIARVLFGLLAASTLLVPLIALSYIESEKFRLVATVLFVLVFVLMLAFLTNANNETIAAIAAGYAAVLTVFIGTQASSN